MRYIKYSKEAAKKAKDDDVIFRLVQHAGDIFLCVVDKTGKRKAGGAILCIDHDHRGIVFLNLLDPDMGLKTDFEGKVLHTDEASIKEMRKRLELTDS